MPSQQQSSYTPVEERDEYQTPRYAKWWAEQHFGAFDIDLAATEENALCTNYFDKAADALAQNWYDHGKHGWCNPPYSDITPWLMKAAEEADFGFATVFLIPSPNSDARDQVIFECAAEIVFVTGRVLMHQKDESGRIAFLRPDGRPTAGNTRGACFVQFSPRAHELRIQNAPRLGYVSRHEMMEQFAMEGDE